MVRRLSSLNIAFAILLYFIVIINVSVARQELGMMFTQNPQPWPAPLGDEVYFECSLNLAAEKFAWRYRPLNKNRWITLKNAPSNAGKTSKLVVTLDNESKAGDYRCIAYYGTSGLASDYGRLTIAKIEPFNDKSDIDITVPSGNTVSINCPAPYSSPDALIQFYKDNEPIKNISSINGKILIIDNVQPIDSGNYHCVAQNYIANQEYISNYKTKLRVDNERKQVLPFFVKQPQNEYKVLRGNNITLECNAVGYPIPKVTWTRLVDDIPTGSKITNIGLNIINVQSNDRGEYHCIWSSGNRKIESQIILTVVEPPRVIKSPKSGTFLEGGELELYCETTGTPQPTFEWLINGETLVKNSHIEMKDNKLSITVVEKKHAGIVQCVASNEYGTHSGCNLLRVTPKQHPDNGGGGGSSSTTSTSSSNNNSHNNNKNHHKNNHKNNHNNHNNNNNNNLRADNSHSSTNGNVRSGNKNIRIGGRRKNKGGHKNKTVLVPPNQPNVTRLSDISAMVRWSVPKNTGLPISFFKVQYRELGSIKNTTSSNNTSNNNTDTNSNNNNKSSKWMTANSEIQSHITSFEVSDLQTDHIYRFRIAAVYSNNDNQLSPNSARFYLTKMNSFNNSKTMPVPLLTNTEALSPNQVLLIWQNTDKNYNIDGFYVHYRPTTTAGDYVKTTVEGKNSTNITISHLQPDTIYEFKIQSFSVDAASEFSKRITRKTLKDINSNGNNIDLLSIEKTTVDSTKTNGNGKNSNMYAIVGGALGGISLLAALGIFAIIYKRSRIKQTRESSQNEGKLMTNGIVMNNGGVADSKINITSNPLSVIDTSETTTQPKSGQQTSLEMTSFINGHNNNNNKNNNNNINNNPTINNDGPTGSGGAQSDTTQETIGPVDQHH